VQNGMPTAIQKAVYTLFTWDRNSCFRWRFLQKLQKIWQ